MFSFSPGPLNRCVDSRELKGIKKVWCPFRGIAEYSLFCLIGIGSAITPTKMVRPRIIRLETLSHARNDGILSMVADSSMQIGGYVQLLEANEVVKAGLLSDLSGGIRIPGGVSISILRPIGYGWR